MSQIKTKFIENSAITNAKVATGIAATKIADGSVTDVEFQYLGGVTSDIQTQLNSLSGAATTFNKETFTLIAGDITNQYVDLSEVAKTGSVQFIVKGGGLMVEGASHDYSLSYTGGAGGNTRVTFLNDLATAGASELIATDVIQIAYAY